MRASIRQRKTSSSQISMFISWTNTMRDLSLSLSLPFARLYHTQKRVLQIINHARKSARRRSHFTFVWNTKDTKRESAKEAISKNQKDSKHRRVHLKGRLVVSYQEARFISRPFAFDVVVSRPGSAVGFKRDAKLRCSEIQARPESLPRWFY